MRGIGPTFIFPTASKDELGQEQWQAGPSAVGLWMGKEWILGVFPQHTMLAPTTQLVARADIHPALIDLLLQTATELHQAGGLFEKAGEFPAPNTLILN